MQFSDLHQLIDHLRRDANIPSRFPVRFINVETMEAWIQTKSFLLTLSHKTYLLSDFCEEEDTAPNLNRLKSKIRKETTSSLIIPLSEYLRIKNDIALRTFVDLLNLNCENNRDQKLRVYIPLYRMKDILRDVKLDARQKDCLIHLNSNCDTDYSLTIIQKNLNFSLPGNTVRGYKEYLRYWEQNPDKPVIFYTQNAINYQDILFADNVTVIINAYELIHYHYRMPANISCELGSENQWYELARGFSSKRTLEDAVCSLLPANQYSNDLFKLWQTYKPQQQWMLWLLAKSKSLPGYLGHVVKGSSNVSEFVEFIYSKILDFLNHENFKEIAVERKKLLQSMMLVPPKSFLERIAQLDAIDQIRCLTDLTNQEKQKILTAFANIGPTDIALDALRISYPDAYYYCSPIMFEEETWVDYFSEYRKQKITDKISDSFLNKINNIAKSNIKQIWQLNSRNNLVNNLYDENSIIFFIDGLGVEYLSLILYKLKNDKYDIDYKIGRCNLPSTTEYNTDFLDGKNHERFYRLDEMKHSYKAYPNNIIEEFDLISLTAKKVEELLQTHSNVIIASDHGTSRMAVLYRNQVPVYRCDENARKEKYGRYCYDTSNDYSELEGCISDNGFWLFANYSHFAEKGAPLCETHGGASPEEMIVPIIRVSKRSQKLQTETPVQITLLTPIVNVGTASHANIIFKLNKIYSSVSVRVGGKKLLCLFSDDQYSFQIAVKSSTVLKIQIYSETKILGETTVKVIKGIMETGFDI